MSEALRLKQIVVLGAALARPWWVGTVRAERLPLSADSATTDGL